MPPQVVRLAAKTQHTSIRTRDTTTRIAVARAAVVDQVTTRAHTTGPVRLRHRAVLAEATMTSQTESEFVIRSNKQLFSLCYLITILFVDSFSSFMFILYFIAKFFFSNDPSVAELISLYLQKNLYFRRPEIISL
jgi:hypothetical protein